jgi:hypothetical protein
MCRSGFRARDFQHLSLASGRILFGSCGADPSRAKNGLSAVRAYAEEEELAWVQPWVGGQVGGVGAPGALPAPAPRGSLPLRHLPGGTFAPPQPRSHQWPPGPGPPATKSCLCVQEARSFKKQEGPTPHAPRTPTPRIRIRNSPRSPAYLGPLGSATLIYAQLRTAQAAPAPAPAPSPCWSPTPPPAPSPQPPAPRGWSD